MNITAKKFLDLFSSALVKGEQGLDDAMDLYLWARDHLKEIHKVSPKYTQGETVVQIKRVFNTDPEVYIRTACRLGGGATQKHADAGRVLIRRFGSFECFRADSLLGPDQMRAIVTKLPKRAGPELFHAAVDKLYQTELNDLQKGKTGTVGKAAKTNYRSEWLKAVKKIAGLEARLEERSEMIAELKKEVNWLKRQMPKLQKAKS